MHRTTVRARSAMVAATAVAAGVALSACGTASAADSQTITWWSPNWDTPMATELIAEFEAENPGVTVELVETTSDTIATQIRTALDSGVVPDLMTELVSRVPVHMARGQLLDLSDLFDADMPTSDFNQDALTAVSRDGEIFGVPWRWDAPGLIYNKDIFEQAGVDRAPTTWAELEEAGRKIQATGVPAFGWPLGHDANTQTRWLTAYYSFGGTFEAQPDGSVSFNAEASERALEMLASGFADGWMTQTSFEADNTALQNMFINGQLGFYIDGPHAVAPIREAGVNLGTAMIPGPDGPGTVGTNGWSFIVPKEAPNPELAGEFIQFLARPDIMARFTATFPARISAGEDPKFDDELLAPFWEQQNEFGRAVPAFPGYSQMTQVIFAAVQKVALGQATAAEANATIVDQAANVLRADF